MTGKKAGSPQYTVSCYCGSYINRNIALNFRRGFRKLCITAGGPDWNSRASDGNPRVGCCGVRGHVGHRVHIRVILMSPHISSRIFKKKKNCFLGEEKSEGGRGGIEEDKQRGVRDLRSCVVAIFKFQLFKTTQQH